MKVKKQELLSLLQKLKEKIEEDNIEEVEIPYDSYWKVLPSEAIKINQESALALGSLEDDWKALKKVITNNNIITYLDFDRTAAILIFYSEEVLK